MREQGVMTEQGHDDREGAMREQEVMREQGMMTEKGGDERAGVDHRAG